MSTTEGSLRRVYFAFEFEKDAPRRRAFLHQASSNSMYAIDDLSLPAAVHDASWQREARKRISSAEVVIVLLGPDTHNAPGVLDELSLAGQLGRPVVQLMPRRRKYGLPTRRAPMCPYHWAVVNRMLEDPQAFVNEQGQQL